MSLKTIIDLGSNSVRLVIYEVDTISKQMRKNIEKDTSKRSRIFKALFNQKKVAGLAAYVKDGVFTKEGIEKAIECLSDLEAVANNLRCDNLHVFATAVLRNCTNSEAAVAKIAKATGLEIDVISAKEEAHLGFIGATCDRVIDKGTLIDVGGGSTELTRVNDDKDFNNISIPQGCVSSYSNSVAMIFPTTEELNSIKSEFNEHLKQIEDLKVYKSDELYGIGGSVRALDKLYAQMFSNENKMHTLETYQIDALMGLFETDPSRTAHAVTKATPERMHSVMPGIAIIRTAMEQFEAKRLTICKYGIREGYLIEKVLKL